MSAEYAPGTVAVATARGVEGVRVFRTDDPVRPWITAECEHRRESEVTDVRPLVALDVEPVNPDYWTAMARHMRTEGFYSAADQIEAQTKLAKPAEPSLWGVVEGRDGNRWVREHETKNLRWRHLSVDRVTAWEGITDHYGPVRVLSEGVVA